MSRVVTSFSIVAFAISLAVCAAPARAQDEKGGIVFRAAEDTGLGDILKARRLELEERQGGPLTGHQWWLWGLGSFDYDRDGDIDLMVCIHGSTNGVILRNDLVETGKLMFVDVTDELGVDGFVPSTDNYPLMWDFDGDGFLDIAGLLNDTKTPCLLNQAGKRFAKAAFSLHPINYPDAIRDLNGDGYIDIAQSIRGTRVQFVYDPKSRSFNKSESAAPLSSDLPAALREELDALRAIDGNRFIKFKEFRRDLTGDGRNDLIVRGFGSYSGDRLGWYLIGEEGSKFKESAAALRLPREGAPILIDDLDHDGDVDVLTASGNEAGLFLNNGNGHFTRKPGPLTEFVKQRCPYLHVAMRADFDYDGDLDLAVSNRRYGREMVFENHGGGEFSPVLNVRGWDADPLVLRDINNDGLVDVIVGGAGEKENIGVYLNVTVEIGNFCQLYPRMQSPNVYAVGAHVELFPAGTLGKSNARPLLERDAPLDGSPISVGLGEATSFDLQATFPGGETRQWKNVAARPKLFITPDGVSAEEPK